MPVDLVREPDQKRHLSEMVAEIGRMNRRRGRRGPPPPHDTAEGSEKFRHVWRPKYAEKGSRGRANLGPAFLTSFFIATLEKLRQEDRYIGRCQFEGCRKVFVRDDPRTRYCSPKHGPVHRMRKPRSQ
jgi:hypothetical protein